MVRLSIAGIIGASCMMVFFTLGAASGVHADEPEAASPEPTELQQRIDFGNAQILGQQIKSGAVYLMHRKKSDIKNMLEVRQHYREEIKDDFNLGGTAITQHTVQTSMGSDP